MIDFLILLLFFVYSTVLFLINNIYVIGLIFVFNIVVSFIVKAKKQIKFLKKNIIFIVFIILCNFVFSSLEIALLIGVKLLLITHYTYIMGYYFNQERIRNAFNYLFLPLKLFKIDVRNLTLIIAISLAFIPILGDEVRMIKLSLRSKGFAFNFKNLITRPHIYLVTFLNILFDRIDELEKSLMIKAY